MASPAPAPGAASPTPAGGTPAAPAAGAPPAATGGAAPAPAKPGVPPNKPGEPAFQLKLEPDTRLVFKGDKMHEGSTTIEIKLTNPTKNRQTFKVYHHHGCLSTVCDLSNHSN